MTLALVGLRLLRVLGEGEEWRRLRYGKSK
jgi:hypothetical protein